MRSLTEVFAQFGYHPATQDTAPKHNGVREAFKAFARDLWALIPEGPEKTLAFRKLQEALMYANLAIALTAPLDEQDAATARVLPTSVPFSDPTADLGPLPEPPVVEATPEWAPPSPDDTSGY